MKWNICWTTNFCTTLFFKSRKNATWHPMIASSVESWLYSLFLSHSLSLSFLFFLLMHPISSYNVEITILLFIRVQHSISLSINKFQCCVADTKNIIILSPLLHCGVLWTRNLSLHPPISRWDHLFFCKSGFFF